MIPFAMSQVDIPYLIESLPSITWPVDSLKTENWAIGLLDGVAAWIYMHRKRGYWEYCDDTGAIEKNRVSPYAVRYQREGIWIIRHGFTCPEPDLGHDQEDYILRGTSAMAWAWDYFYAAGGYFYNAAGPGGSMYDPVALIESDTFFINGFTQAYRLIAGEPSLAGLAASYASYNSVLNSSLTFINANTAQILSDGNNAPNRLWFAAVALNIGGRIVSSTTFKNAGISIATTAASKMHASGYFIEKGGWDSSYQGVSLMNLCTLFFHTADASFKTSVKSLITSAAAWLYSRISDVGSNVGYISTEGNTRTGPSGEVGPSGKVKQVNYSECALAMFYSGCILQEVDYIYAAMASINYIAHGGQP